jgi:hypothetical protein
MCRSFGSLAGTLPVAALCLAIAPLSGCGFKSASLSGTVTYQGKPLTGGSVILYCEDQQIVRGIISPDGAYSIPNVPRGPCRVTVKTHTPIPSGFSLNQELPPVEDGPIPPWAGRAHRGAAANIPERYAIPEESGLTVNVNKIQTIFDIALLP